LEQLVLFYLILGTTSSTAIDDLESLGKICQKYNIWMHVDAAFVGSSCICPEFRKYMNGVEYSMSFNFNPHKWMLTNFDCSTLWVKDVNNLIKK
jgi:aromatic-L-amino-acid/L-tryptophan decarboxylase